VRIGTFYSRALRLAIALYKLTGGSALSVALQILDSLCIWWLACPACCGTLLHDGWPHQLVAAVSVWTEEMAPNYLLKSLVVPGLSAHCGLRTEIILSGKPPDPPVWKHSLQFVWHVHTLRSSPQTFDRPRMSADFPRLSAVISSVEGDRRSDDDIPNWHSNH
jgi:hypothetical protein